MKGQGDPPAAPQSPDQDLLNPLPGERAQFFKRRITESASVSATPDWATADQRRVLNTSSAKVFP